MTTEETRTIPHDDGVPATPPHACPHATTADPELGRRVTSRALLTLASSTFSLLLHGSVLAAAILWIEHTPGAAPEPTEAVSVAFLTTEVLEAVAQTPLLETAAALATVQSDPGEITDNASASAEPPDQVKAVDPAEEVAAAEPPATEVQTAAPQGLEILDGALESTDRAGLDRPAPETAAKPPEKPKPEAKRPRETAKLIEPPPQKTEPHKADSAPRKKGGAASRAAKGSAGSAGQVSASAGSSINYAARVRARVAARKPPGAGRRGTVVIAFGVTRSGGLSYASIARSSGNPGLDRAVLAAVRGAGPFPTPPPGVNLRFAVPFSFR